MSFISLNKQLFALLDCNNFYVSCERLFNPKLRHRPIVVLSNNDGCVIARSNESKALGIPMGAPYFEWSALCKKHGVVVCSANFSLYGDLSHRVMHTLSEVNAEIEIYSIDEAFLLFNSPDPLLFCKEIREKVGQWTGIPVSIGIGRTKTLAKAANKKAKKDKLLEGVFGLFSENEEDALLNQMTPEDLWGIGSRMNLRLKRRGIHTALALKQEKDVLIRNLLSVQGLRTAWELRGIPCFSIEEAPPPKQSIMTSRTFKHTVNHLDTLASLIAAYAARGGEKLREEGLHASCLTVFVTTSRHKEGSYYSNSATLCLPQPTDYTPILITAAKKALRSIFRKGYEYKRGGVLLSDLTSPHEVQQDLFKTYRTESIEKEQKLMALMDSLTKRYGSHGLYFAAEGLLSPRNAKSYCSPAFTTHWDQLLTIKI